MRRLECPRVAGEDRARAQSALRRADGHRGVLGVDRRGVIRRPAVQRWRQRVADAARWRDETRKLGTGPWLAAPVRRIVALARAERPEQATPRAGRVMAQATELSPRTGQPLRAAHPLQPHRLRVFESSKPPAS